MFYDYKYSNGLIKIPSRSVYHFYAKGSTYEELHERNRDAISQWSPYIPDTSFKYSVNAYNHKISQSCQKEIIESFSYMELLGRIDMKNPEVTFGYFEECEFSLTFIVVVLLIINHR